jgi:antirestriction protein ArdC
VHCLQQAQDFRITRPLRHNGIPYQGINAVVLWMAGFLRGYTVFNAEQCENLPAQYVSGLTALKNDTRFIFTAASQRA